VLSVGGPRYNQSGTPGRRDIGRFSQSHRDQLDRYHFCAANRTPEIVPVLVEIPHPEGPLGLKGLTEGLSLPTAPAICNAIFEAVGVRIYDLPAVPERAKSGLG